MYTWFNNKDFNITIPKNEIRIQSMPPTTPSSDEATKENLEKAKEVLSKIDEKDWTKENLEKVLLEVAGEKRGDLLFPLRGSLTGAKKSPSPFECLWVLGKAESLRRVERGIEVC
jgi:glutamyl/glutaminyl-tRNA synthetase